MRTARIPLPSSFSAMLSKSWDCLGSSSACRYAHNKKDQAHHQKEKEQEEGASIDVDVNGNYR